MLLLVVAVIVTAAAAAAAAATATVDTAILFYGSTWCRIVGVDSTAFAGKLASSSTSTNLFVCRGLLLTLTSTCCSFTRISSSRIVRCCA